MRSTIHGSGDPSAGDLDAGDLGAGSGSEPRESAAAAPAADPPALEALAEPAQSPAAAADLGIDQAARELAACAQYARAVLEALPVDEEADARVARKMSEYYARRVPRRMLRRRRST